MKLLRALKPHTFGQKFRKPGEVYESKSDSDANIMVLLKNSEYFVESAPVAPPEVPEVMDEKPAPKPKRPYVRRDQSAGKTSGYNRKDMKADAK